MQKTLLSTKISIPPPRQALTLRSKLLATLAKVRTHCLTLQSALPDSGKTTLSGNWLGETDIPFTWLSLREGKNNHIQFLEHFPWNGGKNG